jgi:putative nucleotidyltransferase with HDIG domain
MPAKLAHVAPFPAVAMKLLSLLSDEDCNFSTIAACICTDPALSGGLIRRANAADLRTYCEARSVLQAVATLGMDRTRELSLAIMTSDYARAAAKAGIFGPCWHHTLACALCASEIARESGLHPVEAYTAALLHDIGRLGLISAYTADYETVIAGAGGHPENLIRCERERFGVDHAQAGEWLAQRWGLPVSIQEVIARHHDQPEKTLDQVGVVQIACRLADMLGFGLGKYDELPDVAEMTAALPEWARTRFQVQLPALREAILREIRLFEGAEDPAPSAGEAPGSEQPEVESAPELAPAADSPWSRLLLTGAVMAGMLLAGVIAHSLWP